MKVIGVTGQVGSGKSQVLDFLDKNYNCRIIKTDEVAGIIRDESGPCHDAVCDIIGKDCINDDGLIDRQKMASVIFADRQKLERVNAVLHPAVKEKVLCTIAEEKTKGELDYIFVESALLLNDDYDKICDEIWYIYVRDEVREKRLMESRGYTTSKIQEILSRQMSDEQLREGCKWVIDNSDDFSLTVEQIEFII